MTLEPAPLSATANDWEEAKRESALGKVAPRDSIIIWNLTNPVKEFDK